MTTRVLIVVPEPNHRPVDVVLMDQSAAGEHCYEATRQRVEVGSCLETYVHSSRKLSIEEVGP